MMPAYYNVQVLARRVLDCNKGLDSLFHGLNLTPDFAEKLEKIKQFYAESFNKTQDEDEGIWIVKHYQKFIVALSEVKNGTITLDDAVATIELNAEDRQIDIIINNILTACELLFWVAVAAISYAACITVGVPLIVAQPLLAVGVMAGTGLAFFIAVDAADDCFEEFQCGDDIDEEQQRETDVVSFFRPAPRKVDAATSTCDLTAEDVYPATMAV